MLVGSCLPHTCALSPPHPLTPQYGGLLKPLHFWGHSVAQDDPFGDVQSRVRCPRDARLGEPYRDRDGTSLPRSPPRAPPCPLSPLCPAPSRHPPSSPCPVLSPHPAPGAAGGALRADYSSRHAPGSLCLRSRTPRPSAVPRGRPASGTEPSCLCPGYCCRHSQGPGGEDSLGEISCCHPETPQWSQGRTPRMGGTGQSPAPTAQKRTGLV